MAACSTQRRTAVSLRSISRQIVGIVRSPRCTKAMTSALNEAVNDRRGRRPARFSSTFFPIRTPSSWAYAHIWGVRRSGARPVAGCAEYGGYRPTVDTYNDPHPQNVSRDAAHCRELARQASGGTTAQAATGGRVGGLIGAASGAAIGAAAGGGNAGRGAAIGGAAGGLGAGTYKGVEADANYKSAFRNCMRNRGHNVID